MDKATFSLSPVCWTIATHLYGCGNVFSHWSHGYICIICCSPPPHQPYGFCSEHLRTGRAAA